MDALRMRPFSRIARRTAAPAPSSSPAVDTNPTPPFYVAVVLKGQEADFKRGLVPVTQQARPRTFLCKSTSCRSRKLSGIQVEDFDDLHPAGNVGTFYIHMLLARRPRARRLAHRLPGRRRRRRPVRHRQLDSRRVVSLAGPVVERPRLLATQLGASLD
ncbi:MAG: hypothetical protein IPJ59_33275 [Nannocystis sp.]|nr:hypothetical protein [Nannocystis sp.]